MDKKQWREAVSLSSFIVWTIWKARNDTVFGRKKWGPGEVISLASQAFHEFCSVIDCPQNNISQASYHNIEKTKWTPPTTPSIKVNCDASWSPNHSKCGLGIVIRDSSISVLLAVSEVSSFGSILEWEALAVRSGLLEAISLGVEALQVESDSKEVINYKQRSANKAPLAIQPISLRYHSPLYLVQ
ncbi:uncharacterized protein LOC122065194 [Macadamia integrifolia]|uniref:uncharacterized protein LOC122065194 n=1 Tax=Macadamia integrifolia TaxID=60698 RepID=UPI001C4F6153|nr:uncharacterized protein LOC122065194 [Macadamia integrifolia]